KTLRDEPFDLLLTDLMMPEMGGVTFLRAALEIDSALVGIVMTGHGTVSTAVEAMKLGALDYILKPFTLSVVLPIISLALNVRRLRLENIQLHATVAIYELSMAIAFALDPRTVVRKMAAAAFQQSDTNSVAVLLPTADGKELCIGAALGSNSDQIEGRRSPITFSVSNWVAEAEKLATTPEQLTRAQPMPTGNAVQLGDGISIPMLAAGKLMGILHFCPKWPERPIPLGRIKTLNILAGTAASALHSVWLLEELRTAEQRYRRLADNAPDVVFRYDLQPERRCVYMNPGVQVISGYAPEDFYADAELAMKIVHHEDRYLLKAAFSGELGGKTITIRWLTRDNKIVWIEQRHVLVHDKEGKLAAVEGIAR